MFVNKKFSILRLNKILLASLKFQIKYLKDKPRKYNYTFYIINQSQFLCWGKLYEFDLSVIL